MRIARTIVPKNSASIDDAEHEDHDHRLVDADEVGVLRGVVQRLRDPDVAGERVISSPAIRLRQANAQPCLRPLTTDGSAAGTTT